MLLSDYSATFFQLFENILLEYTQKLFKRIVFLLRTACKEIDENFLHMLGLQRTDGMKLKTLFVKPKGSGWGTVLSASFIDTKRNWVYRIGPCYPSSVE